MRHIGKVLANTKLCKDIYEIVIDCPKIARESKPGQFLHLKVSKGIDPLLRRPLSISRVCRDTGSISLIYKVIGRGTKDLTGFKHGDNIDVLGPLGNGFTIFPGKKCAVIGGGMGVAPLIELASCLEYCDAYIGFKCDTFKLEEYKELCNELHIATEDGSKGSKGCVTDIIGDIGKYDIVYTCGPKPMMRKVKELCERYSLKCFVSVEERMGCGIGACLVCACRIKEGDSWHYRKVCSDGPVFDALEVDFDD